MILAVKPDVIPKVLGEIKSHLPPEALIVSIAAGVPLSTMEEVSRAEGGCPCRGHAWARHGDGERGIS